MQKMFSAHVAAPIANLYDRFLRLGEGDQTAEEAERIRAVRLSVVGASTPWMMAANLCNAVLTIFAFYGSPSATEVYVICGLILTVAVYTSLSWWRNRKRGMRERASLRGTVRAIVYAAILSGLWAALDVAAYHTADETQRMVLIALTVGMAGGGGFALATIPPASIVFCGTVAVGAAIALSRDPTIVGAYLFVMIMVVTVLRKPAPAAEVPQVPEAESIQDPQLTPSWLDRWAPWLIIALLLVVLMYGPNLFYQISNMQNTSPGFKLW